MRAVEIHLKAISWKIDLKFVESRAFKGIIKTYATGLSSECYFITILFMWALEHNKSQVIRVEIFKCHGLLVLCKTHLFEMSLMQIPLDHRTFSI